LESKALIQVADQTLKNQVRHLESTQAFVEVGTRPAIDTVRLSTEVANSKAALIGAQNNYQLARVRLSQTMGQQISPDYDVEDPAFSQLQEESDSMDELFALAKKERSDLAAQQFTLRSQEFSLKSARRQLVPEMRGEADLAYSNEAWKNPLR